VQRIVWGSDPTSWAMSDGIKKIFELALISSSVIFVTSFLGLSAPSGAHVLIFGKKRGF
jgi:hypothetical protein